MSWPQATFLLDNPSCPAASEMHAGQSLRCANPCATNSVVARFEQGNGPMLSGWDGTDSSGLVVKEGGCEECPIRLLPANVYPLQVQASSDGLAIDVATKSPEGLAETYQRFRCADQSPRVRKLRKRGAVTVPVDLSILTRRQTETLRAAVRAGYFEPGSQVGLAELSEELGCGKSTTHEHMQLGLAKLLGELFN